MRTQTLEPAAADRKQPLPVKEQRKHPRHAYVCRQLVAEFDGNRMPQQDEFSWAMFRDVSSGGMAFLSPARPGSKQLIVAVGPAPFAFMVVEIVRCTRRNDLEGRPYHVGCKIVCELTD